MTVEEGDDDILEELEIDPDALRAAEIASRPQYFSSEDMRGRFADALNEGGEIPLSPDVHRIKRAPDDALVGDNLNWFVERSGAFQSDFRSDLIDEIGKKKTDLFISIVAEDWADGRGRRHKGRIEELLRSVEALVQNRWRYSAPAVVRPLLGPGATLLSIDETAAVFATTWRMLDVALDDWISARVGGWDLGRSDIFVHRGLHLKEMREATVFTPLDYISSYSLAVSVAEQFCQAHPDGRVLVHAEADCFAQRVLFFSPFIAGMDPHQFELGVAPRFRPDSIRFDQDRYGVDDFILQPTLPLADEDAN